VHDGVCPSYIGPNFKAWFQKVPFLFFFFLFLKGGWGAYSNIIIKQKQKNFKDFPNKKVDFFKPQRCFTSRHFFPQLFYKFSIVPQGLMNATISSMNASICIILWNYTWITQGLFPLGELCWFNTCMKSTYFALSIHCDIIQVWQVYHHSTIRQGKFTILCCTYTHLKLKNYEKKGTLNIS